MRQARLISIFLFVSGATTLPVAAQPLTMDITERAGMSVITLRVDDDAEVGGRYVLDVTDSRGNHSLSSGSFAPGQSNSPATISVRSHARAHLVVTLDNGTTYEREWLDPKEIDSD